MMRRFAMLVGMLALGLGFVTLSGALADEKKDEKFDASKLVGTYNTVKGTKYGDAMEKKSLEGTVVIDKEKIQIKEGDKVEHEMTYTVDATKSPVQIDMKGTKGPAEGFPAKGIIELKDDVLKLTYHAMGGDRPTGFESKKDSGVIAVELKRVKK